MRHILIDIKPHCNKVKIWIDGEFVEDVKGATFTMGTADDFTEITFSVSRTKDGELVLDNYTNHER